MSDRYILDGHNPVPCNDLMEWARWFETSDRRVAHDEIGDVRVSTVFLGLNHRFGPGSPLLFETMIFGGPHDQYQERCTFWDDAVKQHAEAVAMARGGLH
jgi:hypothetical protein